MALEFYLVDVVGYIGYLEYVTVHKGDNEMGINP